MPSTYTTRLRLTLPATGELNNTWGNTVNSGITELLDAAIAGTATISTWGGAGVAYTLSNNNGVADEARCMFIVASGAPGEAKNIICPNVSKLYVVTNSVSGGFSVTLKTAAGTGISVENGKTAILRCDGTNVVNAITQLPSFVVAGGTPNQVQFLNASRELTGSANMTFDGTTLSVAALADASLTSGRVTYATTSGNLTDSANLTFDGTSLTLGGNPTLSAGTANGVLYLNGSKVATSGSALQFSGTYLQTLNGTGIQMQNAGATANWFFETSGLNLSFASAQNGAALWSINGSEQMRLNSTGLGIGLTAVSRFDAGQSGGSRIRFDLSSASTATINYSNYAGSVFLDATHNAVNHIWTNGGAELARLTSTGLGIGTSSPQNKLVVSNAGAAGFEFDPTNGIMQTYNRSGAAYTNAKIYALNFEVRTGASPAANTFFLDSSGNLGIGTGSPAYSVDIRNAASTALRVGSNGNSFGTLLSWDNPLGEARLWSLGAYALVLGTNGTERARIDSSGNLGIGTSGPNSRLQAAYTAPAAVPAAGAGGHGVAVGSSGFGLAGGALSSGNAYLQATRWDGSATNYDLILQPNGGNLGIGTSSPARKLHVADAGNTYAAVQRTGATATTLVIGAESGNTAIYSWTTPGGSTGVPMNFYTGASIAMTLDTSGNLGLGVTPSAWTGSGGRNIEVGATGNALFGSVSLMSYTFNANFDSSWKYSRTGFASRYDQQSSEHRWFTAPSGTAGNTISFTQAMTLDASGNLLVGTTTGYRNGRLVVKDVNRTQTSTLANLHVSTTDSQAADLGGSIGLGGQIGGDEAPLGLISGRKENSTSGNYAGYLAFATSSSSAAIAERARITSGGDFGIGVTPTSYGGTFTTLAVNNSGAGVLDLMSGGVSQFRLFGNASENRLQGVTNVPMTFYTNNTERARITSGGNLLVGTTSDAANVRTNITFAGNLQNGVRIVNTAASGTPYSLAIDYSAYAPNNTNEVITFLDTGGARFQVRANGGIANYQANDVNLSDRREKTNFAPAKDYLDTICAIPVQTFTYIDQTDDEKTLGVVAQDVQAVAPELVHESNWGTEDNPKMRLSVYQTDLQYALMKAIQELKAQNDDLRARVAQLERH